ncbi:hypothetical protein GCM10011494_36900 [Novosphingobium endophyticum]|uniref:Cytochrome c domain-containing protein n=1 Tax=Novosphingobium endophyticum TaxID=1955250 RepID=A0A916TVF2_9SPHN|nr:c-type cytochrome [Novosphingobium endophyticum]GGC14703.1 hypothetical protein GCM10011494_36900 [Novosphingobium endophyticum]
MAWAASSRAILAGIVLSVTVGLSPTVVRGAPSPGPAEDAAAGEVVFKKRCAACHAVAPGQNRLGPTMAGVVGRKVGSTPGYKFSQAFKDGKIAWTPKNLDKFLANPRVVFPGTKMSLAGVSDPKDRTDLIRYLASLK